MNVAESLALVAAFCSGVFFMLAASRRMPEPVPPAPAAERVPEPQGRPVIGAPPGWKP